MTEHLPRPDRNYPVSTKITEDGKGYSAMFTAGVWIDVVKVLTDHGFPQPTGMDIVDLQMALFDFVFTNRRGVPGNGNT